LAADIPRRTLVVANRTAATPSLLNEVARRARERPTRFTLLVPRRPRARRGGVEPDWTLERALVLLERAARGPVEGYVAAVDDPFDSVRRALGGGGFDEVIISTFSTRTSEWLRRDLPRRVRRLGVPMTVITTPDDDGLDRTAAVVGSGAASRVATDDRPPVTG
jgi:hypothetical protein